MAIGVNVEHLEDVTTVVVPHEAHGSAAMLHRHTLVGRVSRASSDDDHRARYASNPGSGL
ncbi:hypothetical protein [Streptomyces spectabilis]|uniref:hypothetical protein n=1 Tax=Streptomyces spectabilis TaxID=68270 RepID=UPI0033E0E065